MKTKMLSLFLVILSLQAMPIKADSGHYFSLSTIKSSASNTASWLSEKRKKHLPRKRIVAITALAATTAATALVAYLYRDPIKDGYQSVYGKLFNNQEIPPNQSASLEFDNTNLEADNKE